MQSIEWYLLIGGIAGTMAGLLGVGGGIIVVPALIMVFETLNLQPEHLSHLAVGTSLATIAFTALSSIRAHHLASLVEWPIVKQLTPGILIGAIVGANVADQLSGKILQGLFGLFAIAVSAKMVMQLQPKSSRDLPQQGGMILAGGVIGSISSLFGIGGGTLTVPYLSWCQVPIKHAIGTSAACGLPIAFFGAISFAVTGMDSAYLPEGSTGYIYWPAVLGIVIPSMICAHFGAKLAHILPAVKLKQIFGLLLCLVGLKLIWLSIN